MTKIFYLFFFFAFGDFHSYGDGWEYFCFGNCSNVETTRYGGSVYMGGGRDVDEAFVWMVQRSGGGNFLVLRASGTDAYNKYVYDLENCQSVATLIINSTKANDSEFVLSTILQADALWFAGGDQSKYYNFWNGPISETINIAVKNKVPVGGTSAGMAILGKFVYTAEKGSVVSDYVLKHPEDPQITIADDFLVTEKAGSVLTDMHFAERNRMGRLVVFMANAYAKDDKIKGFACDEATAFLMSPSGVGQLVGTSSAYALSATEKPMISKGKPLNWNEIMVSKLEVGDLFDFVNWKKLNPTTNTYTLNVKEGYLKSSTGSVY